MIQRLAIQGGGRAEPVRLGLAGMMAVLLAACGFDHPAPAPAPTATPTGAALAAHGRLRVRPPALPTAEGTVPTPGLHAVGLGRERDGLVYVPAGYQPGRPLRLVVLLHGAGGNAQQGIGLLQPLADAAQLLLFAPDSRGDTWDVIRGGYGPDVRFIDQALEGLFQTYAVDATHLAIGGFSDGASYALSLGLTNGDLFTHILAFSPGFMAPDRTEGQPRIFITHGTQDTVLPIEQCSRRIVPQRRRAGYAVTYHEFDGPHTVPANIARQGVDWFTGPPP